MNLDLLQITLILWLIERVSIHRPRYKLAIDTNGQFVKEGYWSIWIYCKDPDKEFYWRSGGRRLIAFKKYIIPYFR